MKQLSIIGPNTSSCTEDIYAFGVELGKSLAAIGYHLVCGGMGGLMEAVCKGTQQIQSPNRGRCIGLIPGIDPSEANPYCDIVIPTGVGFARNLQVVLSGELLIAVAGGAGTLSEIAYAWQYNKPVLCVCGFGGWSEQLAGKAIDKRKEGLLHPVKNLEEIIAYLDHER